MATTTTDPMIGRLVDGRYQIRERIARGGMATVYLAYDRRLTREVAVKVMHPHLAEGVEGAAFVSRFRREARAAARLAHPGTVAVYDQGLDGDTSYLTMEYVPGTNLRTEMRAQGALTLGKVLAILDQVLAALAAAHRKGLIHRDVKPENVLIDDEGQVKVADFGLARAATEVTSTTTGIILGTVAYLAPEVIATGTCDARTDVYAVGVLGFELLTGHLPHDGATPIQLAFQHVHDDVPATSDEIGWVPPELCKLLRKYASRDPGERPIDAGVALAELRLVRRAIEGTHPELLTQKVQPPREWEDTFDPEGTAVRFDGLDDLDPAAWLADAEGGWSGEDGLSEGARRRSLEAIPAGVFTPTSSDPDPSGRPAWLIEADVANLARGRPVGPGSAGEAAAGDAAAGEAAAGLRGPDGSNQGWPDQAGPDQVRPGALVTEAIQENETREVDTSLAPNGNPLPPNGAVMAQVVAAPTAVPVAGGKSRRRVLASALIALVVLAGGGASAWWWSSEGPGAWVTVPPGLLAMAETDAHAALVHHGLAVEVNHRFDDSVPEGQVISADPASGAQVRRHSTVSLVVSDGVAQVTVPEGLIGLSRIDAEEALLAASVRVTSPVREYSDIAPLDQVLAVSPGEGKVIPHFASVQLTLSNGPAPVTVPQQVGRDVDAATSSLVNLGLRVEFTPDETSETFAAGRVIRQSPANGELVRRGDTVTLTISAGPPIVAVPDVVGLRTDAARAALEQAGFRVQVNHYLGGILDTVRFQSATGEAPKGSTITLTIW